MREVTATGLEAVLLASRLLQRARRADPVAGLWEAADVQWWWRTPRRSDAVDKLFWVDEQGPVAGVLLTSWTDADWQCDPLIVPGAARLDLGVVWTRAMEHAAEHAAPRFRVPVGDDDRSLAELARQSGLVAGDRDCTGWLAAGARPAVLAPPPPFVVADRTQRAQAPHPMHTRSGVGVAQRLGQCPLYDPALDLSVEAEDGRVAGYALFWFDPVTKVGLVEPVRVEEAFQRRGLARTMLTIGIDRLAARGAERIKISWETEAAGALYQSLGFTRTSTATWHRS